MLVPAIPDHPEADRGDRCPDHGEPRLTPLATRLYLALSLTAAAPQLAAQTPPASAVGLVTDEQGQPIPNAYVTKTGRTEDRYLTAVDSTRPIILPGSTTHPPGKTSDRTEPVQSTASSPEMRSSERGPAATKFVTPPSGWSPAKPSSGTWCSP